MTHCESSVSIMSHTTKSRSGELANRNASSSSTSTPSTSTSTTSSSSWDSWCDDVPDNGPGQVLENVRYESLLRLRGEENVFRLTTVCWVMIGGKRVLRRRYYRVRYRLARNGEMRYESLTEYGWMECCQTLASFFGQGLDELEPGRHPGCRP